MSVERLVDHEMLAEAFAFRRVMSALGVRFGSAVAAQHRNPDYRMFTIVPPERDDHLPLVRMRLALRASAEGDLQLTASQPEAYFDVGLPIQAISTEAPELAQLGDRAFIVLYPEPSSPNGVIVDAASRARMLPDDFADIVRDELVVIPMRQRPLTD